MHKDVIFYSYGYLDEDGFNKLADKLRDQNEVVNISKSQLAYLLKYYNDKDHFVFCEYCGKYREWEKKKCKCYEDE